MGTGLKTYCRCGYDTMTVSGSSRAQHGKVFKFPHLCRQCKSAVSIDLLAEHVCCPDCGSSDVESYATKSKLITNELLSSLGKELLSKRGYHTREDQFSNDFCYVLNEHFVILRDGNECPACGEKSLRFFSSIMFD
jgi:RNA polymerase subunit RPABC4/transcription elongation factor Spt4